VKEGCERYRQELAALRLGEAPELPAGELESHLAKCAECRAARDESARLFELLDDFQPEPAADGARRLRLAISTGKYLRGPSAPARRRAVSLPLAAAAAAAAFLVALWLGSQIEWDADPVRKDEKTVAVLTAAHGLQVDGAGTAPRAGDPLVVGKVLRLADDGHASLVLHRGARVELAGGSVFRVPADDVFYLQSGRLLAVVRKGGRPFRVRTPLAEVTTLGTRFTVDVRAGATKVTVIEGRVRFAHTGPGDGSVEVAGRQTSTVLAGAGPTRPGPAGAEDLAWRPPPGKPRLRLVLNLDRSRVLAGESITARLTLTNESKRRLNVDGTGRGRSSYFLRVEDPAGRRSHFCPTVLSARVDGVKTRAPLVGLPAGGRYELEMDLGGFARRPGEYRVTAVYLESAASASTGWSGAVESGEQKLKVEAPAGKRQRDLEETRKEIRELKRLIDGPKAKVAE
jgi:ferric-dicitrate binding protein FerR (iron transport regulator)